MTASADTLTDTSASQKIDISSLPPNATLTLTLAPSLASSLFPALDYLASYPSGNAEATMSSLLPDIAVARAFKARGAASPPRPKLAASVSLGLQKLYRYQHSDGGWNWWEFDQTDGDMTAYVLSGLVEARQAGFLVDDQRLLRGTEALKRLLTSETELGRRADWLLTLAQVSPKDAAKPLEELYAKRRPSGYLRAGIALSGLHPNGRREKRRSGPIPGKDAGSERQNVGPPDLLDRRRRRL